MNKNPKPWWLQESREEKKKRSIKIFEQQTPRTG
jgi:hypothetical protein